MPNTSLTKEAVLSEVKQMLGSSSIDVELIENDVAKCIKDALRVYNHNLPMRSRKALVATAAQKRYVIAHPQLEGITEVEFVTRAQYTGLIDPFTVSGLALGQSLAAAPGTDYGVVMQQQMYIEDVRKIVSAEPEWYAQWEYESPVPEYALYVDIPKSLPYYVAYTYAWHLTPDNAAGTGMQLVPNEDVDWVMEYTLARAKQILARKLGKFGGITNPDGAPDPTDSAELRQEGREDQLRMEEQMKQRRRPLLPVVD